MTGKIDKKVMVALLVLLVTLIPLQREITASEQKPTVFVDPRTSMFSTDSMPAGSEFTIDIRTTDWPEPGVFAYEFRLLFDSSMIEAVSVELPEGHWFTPEDPDNIFSVWEIQNEQMAYVYGGAVLLDMAEPAKTEGGVMVRVTFKIIAEPSYGDALKSALTLDDYSSLSKLEEPLEDPIMQDGVYIYVSLIEGELYYDDWFREGGMARSSSLGYLGVMFDHPYLGSTYRIQTIRIQIGRVSGPMFFYIYERVSGMTFKRVAQDIQAEVSEGWNFVDIASFDIVVNNDFAIIATSPLWDEPYDPENPFPTLCYDTDTSGHTYSLSSLSETVIFSNLDTRLNLMIRAVVLETVGRILSDVPYVHQCYDTPNEFVGGWACAPTCAVMILAYYDRIWPNPIIIDIPTKHSSVYGAYVSREYTYRHNIFSTSATVYIDGCHEATGKGAWGYIWQDETGTGILNRLKGYLSLHDLRIDGTTYVYEEEEVRDKVQQEIDNGKPLIALTGLTEGHYVVVVGYEIDSEGNFWYIVNDPFGEYPYGSKCLGDYVPQPVKYDYSQLKKHRPDIYLILVAISPTQSIMDLNADSSVNIHDLFIVSKAFGSHGPAIPNPGDPASEKWNPIADVNNDGWISIKDLFEVAKDYGKTV